MPGKERSDTDIAYPIQCIINRGDYSYTTPAFTSLVKVKIIGPTNTAIKSLLPAQQKPISSWAWSVMKAISMITIPYPTCYPILKAVEVKRLSMPYVTEVIGARKHLAIPRSFYLHHP